MTTRPFGYTTKIASTSAKGESNSWYKYSRDRGTSCIEPSQDLVYSKGEKYSTEQNVIVETFKGFKPEA